MNAIERIERDCIGAGDPRDADLRVLIAMARACETIDVMRAFPVDSCAGFTIEGDADNYLLDSEKRPAVDAYNAALAECIKDDGKLTCPPSK